MNANGVQPEADNLQRLRRWNMSLIGKNNEEKIWNFLTGKGLNSYGAAGLMGNLFAESGLNPQNLQNSYEKKLGFTDATYTAAVDSGVCQLHT